jgi:hypothetical protein
VPHGLRATEPLAAAYDQIESSVGQFATDTLIADTKALASGSSSDDSAYQAEQSVLAQLAQERDALAARIRKQLNNGHGVKRGEMRRDLRRVSELLRRADALAGS